MSSTDIYTALESIFSDVLGRPGIKLTEATTAQDVEGWDSLTHIDLISSIESHFRIRFNIREVQRLPNVGALVGLIENKVTT
ncbi:acyl carrier protein [Trinickia violacea]|uniref:Acyl carrier protein n=1 Tax=Trinickia violacea TaxID=2571746 RepID=A0A4P8IQX4_9BURK|nr:acyl carrier protein [Trinickia violacea]QCP50756.1 acyl carrier protein [Trinickia violacea]